jgi:hypothetical protein
MCKFDSLVEVVAYIAEDEDYRKYIWNNSAGMWDLEDILFAAEEYDGKYKEYAVDASTYNISSGEELLFANTAYM